MTSGDLLDRLVADRPGTLQGDARPANRSGVSVCRVSSGVARPHPIARLGVQLYAGPGLNRILLRARPAPSRQAAIPTASASSRSARRPRRR